MSGLSADRIRTRYGRLYAPAGDMVIGRSLKLYGEWAENEIDSLCRPLSGARAIFDVGANIGTHAGAFARRFPDAPVLAFEPQPMIYALLAANVVANDWRNCRPIQAALGAQERILSLALDYESVDNAGAVTLAQAEGPSRASRTPVVMTTLDTVASTYDVELIKIDVEGMESEVLQGARETLARCRPFVFFEVLTVEGLRSSRQALEQLDYALFWLRTSAFNPDNYNLEKTNIWARGEVGVFAAPAERASALFGERVPDEVLALPDEVASEPLGEA